MAEATNQRGAVARIVLGVAQMTAAAASLLLLVQTGVTPTTLVAVIITCVLTSTSVFLFGRKSPRHFRGGSGPDSSRER
jgi:cobalamin synthase